ncbi:MAG: hypothetical protein VX944_04370 [Myxococcota bacterium]|nr:hypothetical protein [Myxococcota bacterium]MEC9389288.1 hypothetical protein [Myxococcota bacterium]
MNKTIQYTVAACALMASTQASAGAIGLTGSAGLQQQRAYYYGPGETSNAGIDSQMRPNYGIGLEAIVGDKDEKVQGILRLGFLQDSPTLEPDTGGVAGAVYPAAHLEDPRNVGTLGLGVQWGVLGDPSGTQLTISSVVGTGFITTDNTEFLLVEAGVGGTHNLTSTLQATATLMASMRHRKHMSFGPNLYAGFRYLFD